MSRVLSSASLPGWSLARAGALLTAALLFCFAAGIGANPLPNDAPPGESVKIINELLAKGWQDNNLTPAERCSDHEFIRRASLDIIGRIATVEEIERYLKDPADKRRSVLVERLLHSPEHARSWADRWTHWLLAQAIVEPLPRAQLHLWLQETLADRTVSYRDLVERLVTATGKTWENGAVNFPLAHLGATLPEEKWAQDGQFDMQPFTSAVSRVFLGVQVQCAACHCHPFNADIKLQDFWGINAFLRQVERVGSPDAGRFELRDNAAFNKKGIVFFENRAGVFGTRGPTFLDGRTPGKNSPFTRRQDLARLLTSHKNFAPMAVNRIWGQFFGRGMNARPQVDDFGDHNDVVHEELLAKLSADFIAAGYDHRQLIQWICASDAYNLRAVGNPTTDTEDAPPYFARMALRSLTAEQLLDSLWTATQPYAQAAKTNPQVAVEQRALRRQWREKLGFYFGEGENGEANFNGTVVQALLMMNGQQLETAISPAVSDTLKTVKKFRSGKEVCDYLFLVALNRPATDKEYQQIVSKLRLGEGKADQDANSPAQDLFWALLNSNEFILNH